MTIVTFENAGDAIRDANFLATQMGRPYAVGYIQGKGWCRYSVKDGAPPDVVPEFMCFALGKMPLPLSEDGWLVLQSIMRNLAVA